MLFLVAFWGIPRILFAGDAGVRGRSVLNGVAAAGAERRLTLEIRVPPDVARMLRISAAEHASRHGGRPSVSTLVGALITEHWRGLGGPVPPLLPEAPANGVQRGRAA